MITKRILKMVSIYLSDCAAANAFIFHLTGEIFESLIYLSIYYSEEQSPPARKHLRQGALQK